MAKTGVLDYQRYLNTLQTLNDLGQTFPSNQQTYNFSVVGGTTSSWTATISWETLILDKVTYSSKETGYVPNVDSSQIVGYFDGGTGTQYTTGVISLPANMYTGPMLPGGDFNVPLTVVHLSWFNGITRYAQQIGFIQNWEPGVEIGDPAQDFDYHPVYGLESTLTLAGPSAIVYGDDLVLTATTDMGIDLGVNKTRVRFYRSSTGTDVVIGTAYFTGTVATLVLPTNPNLPINVYDIYAISQPRNPYNSATSNHLSLRVEAGVPLLVNTSTFTPSQTYYYPGQIVNYRLGVKPDPAFTATGIAVSNPISIKLVDQFTPYTETNILNANFVQGQTNTNFTVQSSMIDTARTYSQTHWSITTSTQTTSSYTATLFVYNTETVTSTWGYQTIGRYMGGTTSTSINVGTSTTVTVIGQPFPLTITQSSTNTFVTEEFIVTVNNPNVAYYNSITIYAQKGATIEALSTSSHSGTSTFTASVYISSSTGTWTLYASYPGDVGLSLINANLASTSNSLNHVIRNGNELLPKPVLTFYRTTSSDILIVTANTSTTLTNIVSFYEGTTLLGTGTWVRNSGTVYRAISEMKTYKTSGFARNFEAMKNLQASVIVNNSFRQYDGAAYVELDPYVYPYHALMPVRWKDTNQPSGTALLDQGFLPIPDAPPTYTNYLKMTSNGMNNSYITPVGWASPGYDPNNTIPGGDANYWGSRNNMTVVNQQQGGAPSPKFPNKFHLFKYYDGTNYNLNAVTGTNISAIADPITFGSWGANDISRVDKIGDSRGYNVMAIEVSSTPRPLLNTPSGYTERVAFPNPRTGVSDNYVDLVEFIGTATWQTAYYEEAVWPSNGGQKTIQAWLYRFTPEIPQGNTDFTTFYPIQTAFQRAPNGEIYRQSLNDAWINYGSKQFTNSESNLFNDWYTAVTNPLGTTITSQAGSYGASNTQTVTLTLPRNTITNLANVHAVWTGTQNLSVEYGKFYGFDIYISTATTNMTLDAYTINSNNQYFGNPVLDIARDANAIRLVASVNFDTQPTEAAEMTGSVVFFEEGTNRKFGVSTLTNQVATLDVYASTLYNGVGSRGIHIQSRFTSTNATIASTASTVTKSVIAYSDNYFGGSLPFDMQYVSVTPGTTSTYTLYKAYQTPSGKTQTSMYGSIRVRVPFFANTTGQGTLYFQTMFSENSTGTYSTPVALPIVNYYWPDPPYGSLRLDRVSSNKISATRDNRGDYSGYDITLFFWNQGIPNSMGGANIKVTITTTSTSAAAIPTSAQVGFQNFLSFQYLA